MPCNAVRLMIAINGEIWSSATDDGHDHPRVGPPIALYHLVPVLGVMIAYFSFANLIGYVPEEKEGKKHA